MQDVNFGAFPPEKQVMIYIGRLSDWTKLAVMYQGVSFIWPKYIAAYTITVLVYSNNLLGQEQY